MASQSTGVRTEPFDAFSTKNVHFCCVEPQLPNNLFGRFADTCLGETSRTVLYGKRIQGFFREGFCPGGVPTPNQIYHLIANTATFCFHDWQLALTIELVPTVCEF